MCLAIPKGNTKLKQAFHHELPLTDLVQGQLVSDLAMHSTNIPSYQSMYIPITIVEIIKCLIDSGATACCSCW